MRTNILVIGLGNTLLRDEGIGVRAVEALEKNFEFLGDLRLKAESLRIDQGAYLPDRPTDQGAEIVLLKVIGHHPRFHFG